MPSPLPFSAVLVAGGRSSRMGRDKALLPHPGGGLLWQRQLEVLRALRPAELLISGPPRAGFPADTRLIADANPGLGPLSGIAAALAAAACPLVVVLAVDLPAMTADYLGQLVSLSGNGRGAVPLRAGFFEPLAAVYPRDSAELAALHLGEPDRSMQRFVRAASAHGLIVACPVRPGEEALFANWNTAAT